MIKSVFDVIDLEDGDASVLLAKIQFKKDSYQARMGRIAVMNALHIENKGECEGCGNKICVRWVDNGVYICYDCFYEDCKMQGDMGYYHSRPAEDVEEYIDECEWDDLWEKENIVDLEDQK